MAGQISWQQFEAINTRLQKTFAKTGKVTKNERLPGRISGGNRQIDVVIRVTVGTEKLLIIVECKKWNRKIDVKAVEAFCGVKKDVGANAAIMISTNGFSKAARATAELEGISLYRYEDTLRAGWPNGLETNVLLEVWDLTPTVARLIHHDLTEEDASAVDDFIPNDGSEMMGLATVICKIWDGLPASEKYERDWAVECPCHAPERPEIKKLLVGAKSKKIRGYRKGCLQFEGLIDESKGIAKVEGWKMVFAGDFTPIPPETLPPVSGTYQIHMKTTHVRTQDPRTEGMMKLVYDGILEVTITNKTVSDLPIGNTSLTALRSYKKEK